MTDERDLDLIVTAFIQTEDQNFALFNYVNEQNCEIEMLQDKIDDVSRDACPRPGKEILQEPLLRSGQVWRHTAEQRVAAPTLRRYSSGLRLATTHSDARPAMPIFLK